MEGGLVRFASGSSVSILSSPFHDLLPPRGDNAARLLARLARLSARLARPIGSRGAGTNGTASSSASAASHGVEVANGAGVAISSWVSHSSKGMDLVLLGGGDAADSPLAAPRVVSADQIEGVGALSDRRGRRGGGVGGPPALGVGRTFGIAPVDAAAAPAAASWPDGDEVSVGAAMPAAAAGPSTGFPAAAAGAGPAKAADRRSRCRVHLLQN